MTTTTTPRPEELYALAYDGILPFRVQVEEFHPGERYWIPVAQGSSVEWLAREVADLTELGIRARLVTKPYGTAYYAA